MAFPLTVLGIHVEIYIGGTWVDITSDVLGEGAGKSIDTHRGRDDGLSNVQYGTATMELKNTLGKYSPRNPNSIYYGLLGKNTPLRVFITPHWTTGNGIDDADTFTRTVVDGWGSTSSMASAYSLSGYGGSVLTSDWQVNGSYGIQYVPSAAGYRASALTAMSLQDVDVYATVDTFISSVAGGNIELGGIGLRNQGDGRYYFARIDIDPSEVMKATLYYGDSVMLAQATVSTFTWSGQAVRVRARIIGNEFSYKIWDAATSEPSAWSVTVEDTQLEEPGTLLFRSGIGAGNTNTKPIEFRWDDITITNIITRFTGEVSDWPIWWDTTGSDVRVNLSASGILCRYNQGLKTPRSPFERAIRYKNPIAYWSLDDGPQADLGGSAVLGEPGFPSIGPMEFSKVEGPVGAPAMLPQMVQDVATGTPAMTTLVSGNSTDAWTMDFIINVTKPDGATTWTYTALVWSDDNNSWIFDVYGDSTTSNYLVELTAYNATATIAIQMPLDIVDSQWHHIRIESENYLGSMRVALLVDNTTYLDDTDAGMVSAKVKQVTLLNCAKTYMQSASVGHIAIYAGIGTTVTYDAFIGYPGESISTRTSRLSLQDSVGVVLKDDGTSALLTAQRQAQFVELMQDMQAADLGILFESRGSRTLTYRALNNIQAQTPVELDYTAHELTADAGFLPIDDDQAIWNDVTVERYNASRYRLEKTTGTYNTADPPNGVGTYDRGVFTTHVASDASLPDVAGWLSLLGTWDEYRWPAVPVNLARSQFATDQQFSYNVALLDIGDALSVVNLPAWIPPMPLHGIIQGYSEHLSNFEWSITFITTPAGPYEIATVAGAQRVCAEGDMTLAIAIDSDDTLAQVFSTSGAQRWCHDDDDAESASDYPMNVLIAGELVSATDCNYPIRDGFDRTNASSWETTDTGETWDTTGSNATYSTATPYGSIAPISLSTDCRCIIPHGASNHEVRVQTKLPSLAAFTVSMRTGLMVRCTDASNFYTGYMLISAAGGIQLIIVKRVAGTPTQLGSSVVVNRTYVADELWYMQMRVTGSTVSFKAWPVGSIEPGWQVVRTDTSLTTGTYVGCLARNNGAAAGAQVDFTEFRMVSPQELTIVRTSRGIAHAAGADIDVAEQAHVGL